MNLGQNLATADRDNVVVKVKVVCVVLEKVYQQLDVRVCWNYSSFIIHQDEKDLEKKKEPQ